MKRALLAALLLFALAGCERAPEVHQHTFFAFGTLVELSVADPDPKRAARAAEAVEQAFHDYHRLWHAWHPGPLVDLNRALAAGAGAVPEPSIRTLLERAAPLAEQSGYRFDPAIGGLVALWGFHGDTLPEGPPPGAEALRDWREHKPSLADLYWDEGRLFSRNPALQLDFGAFAKGYAVDQAIARLRALGIDNAIVNAGGDLRAIGRRPDRPWRIGIRHPRNPEVLASIAVEGDESLFTSGDYERFFEHEGQRFHHILDPFSGRPAAGTTSVTVLHGDATTADAAATALFVAGPEHWQEVARAMGLRHVMLIDTGGVAHLTPAMAARVRFEAAAPPPVRLSAPMP
jgi:thiamine biosynthesis lipoprotein